MKHLIPVVILMIVIAVTLPAVGQSWGTYIEENPGLVHCSPLIRDIPVAGATDCDTAKEAAWDLLTKLQTKGCVDSRCPVGSIVTRGEGTCKYDPFVQWPRRRSKDRWQVTWTWTCSAAPLACCRCLGEAFSIDLSTGPASTIDPRWEVNGGPAYVTFPYAGWTNAMPPARWIQPVASPSPVTVAAGLFNYTLPFTVPECLIPMNIRLEGQFAADNSAKVLLDGSQIGSCAGPNCFSAATAFSASVAPGNHTLEFQVTNLENWSGLIVNAQLKTQCAKDDRPLVTGSNPDSN
jgi:hypothetical protein